MTDPYRDPAPVPSSRYYLTIDSVEFVGEHFGDVMKQLRERGYSSADVTGIAKAVVCGETSLVTEAFVKREQERITLC